MPTPELAFATPAELIAALPHILGYVPVNDVIALLLGPTDNPTEIPLRAAIRCPVDLDAEHAQRFPTLCHLTRGQFQSALLVAVCDPDHDNTARSTLHTMRDALRGVGVTVRAVFTTHSVTTAGRWVDPDTGANGATTPYTDSPATALGVVEGRVIAGSRDEVQREFSTTEPAPHLDLEAQDLAALIADTATTLHRAITGNRAPTTELAARAAAVVTAHAGLRDAFLRLGVDHELSAGRVWTCIAAQHRGRVRAELLTMAAVAYYCAEDTVRAGLALGHAAVATEDDDSALPRLAEIIYTALDAGMPPSRIRSVIPDRNAAPIPGTTL
jgi:hypothetical protein